MTRLYAQPYDICAIRFYFESGEEYAAKAGKAVNAYGSPVEEFEIQFIDGEGIDVALFNALGVHQGNFPPFFGAVADWSDDEKIRIIIAVGEGGYQFDLGSDAPGRIDIDLYECDSLRDLAMQFVDDGLFGDIPAPIANYLDYDAIARDVSVDYAETVFDGRRYVFRLG